MIRLPINIEQEVKSFIQGERDKKSWVHEFLQYGICAKHNYIYERNYNLYLMEDILKYLKKYYIKEYEKWRKRWIKKIKS